MATKMMKGGPWQALLHRAHAVGIDTSNYSNNSDSAERLRQKIVEAEQRQHSTMTEDRQAQTSRRVVELAGLPVLNSTPINVQQVSREFSHYMLLYVNHLCGGPAPKKPKDILTAAQLAAAESVAVVLHRDTR